MIIGMSVETFTLLHVIISLIGIATGLIVVYGLLTQQAMPRWTAIFLLTTVLTSVTGFMFHSAQIGPPHIVGAISLVVLAVALFALYGKHLVGFSRVLYIFGAVFSLYLNSFVGVVQAFQKIPFFNALAPTQKEPPFLIAQALTLVLFIALGVLALRKFHPGAPSGKIAFA
jgi:hypothetical protein